MNETEKAETQKINGDKFAQILKDHPELKILKNELWKRYEFMDYLGMGGFSKVFKIRDKKLERVCSLTTLRAERLDNSEANTKNYFINSARALAQCRHPNIVSIFEIGSHDKLLYHIGEYIEGSNLKDIIHTRGKLELNEAIKISQSVLAGLGYLHKNGIIYRNIKPRKILIETKTGRIVLAFTSIILDKKNKIQEEGRSSVGTRLYMSPEQFRDSNNIDRRSDIYSFGIALYEMLTGECPFTSYSISEILIEHLEKTVPNIRDKRPDLPEGFEMVIYKALARKPVDRYQNTDDFLADIERLLGKNKVDKDLEKFKMFGSTAFFGSSNIIESGIINLDDLENKLRIYVSGKVNRKEKWYLSEILNLSSERSERLKNEFGFIYNLENPEQDELDWKQNEKQIEWRRKVWRIASARNEFNPGEIENKEEKQNSPGQTAEEVESKQAEEKIKKSQKSSEAIGEELEQAFFKLFRYFLETCFKGSKTWTENERQQTRGPQYGFDLKFVIFESGGEKTRFLIECKNLSTKVTLDNIAGKLAAAKEYHYNVPIDHWILVSPNEIVSNDLDKYLESWEKRGEYPFNIHIITPATKSKEFFGLIPEIYDKIITERDLNPHPSEWSDEKKTEVIEYWKEILEPPLRLPAGWEQYMRNPRKMTLEPKESEFEKLFNANDFVTMNCKDETGALLPETLEEKILDWLEEPVTKSPVLFLLGEFGDGKTFFTYTLSRKLTEKFLKSPKDSWIPVRFALKNFTMAGITNARELLRSRLEDFNADISGWNELRSNNFKILAILDGFDEISKELDPDTIQKNIDILIDLYGSDYFSGLKLMITSRKHFFETQKEKDWLIDKLDNPRMLHLAPIDRKTVETHLRTYAISIGEEEKFNKIKNCHDPLEMASKPLFLEMVRSSLKSLPEGDVNEYILYETYIRDTLKRKIEFNFDRQKKTPKEKIIDNLRNLMELVALRLHQKDQEFVYLSDIRAKEDLKKWLWDIIDPDAKILEDESGRAATRSLLKRVHVKEDPELKKQDKSKRWPVDFCHRSIREYFTARAVCNMLQHDLEEGSEFLTQSFLNYEILFFAGEIMKHTDFNFEANLLDLVHRTKNFTIKNKVQLGYLGGNAVNLLYKYKGRLPGNDWSHLLLDGAILPGADLARKNFSHTSLQCANLDNVDFTQSDFTNCDLSEVRIEETTPVQSIAISPGENILALYHEGIIREWTCKEASGRCGTTLPGNITGKEIKKLVALPGNDLTLLDDRYLYFYDRTENELKQRAKIEIRQDIDTLKISRATILLNDRRDNQNRLLLIDLDRYTIIKSFYTTPFTLCDHLGTDAFVIANEVEDVRIIDLSENKRPPLLLPVKIKVTCLSVWQCAGRDGQYLVGLGLYNGIVQIWEIDCKNRHSQKLLEHGLHKFKQPVKDIVFLDENHIVSGGLDKTIAMLAFNEVGNIVGTPREFKMTLQCQGMKIEGVQREIERNRLKELIAASSL